jgi:sporulation protein YlmC with PRC-barrel domain
LLAAPTLEAASRQKVAQQCVTDLQAFHDELQKGGYWLSSSGYGGGYPRYGYVYGERGMMLPIDTFESKAEVHARPGYEIRTLMASAHIMAQRGQQAACEALLAETRDIYKDYAANLNKTGVAKADMSGWQNQLIAAAQPVTSSTASFRSDQLIGAAVVTPHNDSLGSVDDIVLSPLTGKISYLVIGHGGLFGIDEKYAPVPWEDFKMTPGATLLVLDSDKNALDAGPQVRENQFSANGDFAQESRKVDDYWKAHLAP